MNYWLLKSEPETFSLDHLIQAKNQTTMWEGVRNYQARNFLKMMRCGDLAFFYHSNCKEPGIVGTCEIIRESYPDPSAFDPKSSYFDSKSKPEQPRWFVVDVKFKQKFSTVLTLAQLKQTPGLQQLRLVQKGNRLSVMPIAQAEWLSILAMLPPEFSV